MAASDAAVPSALGGRADRRSPPPASQSKRDRKRQAVMERLALLHDKFQHDKDSTYRDQLQRVQFELNNLQKFDPYTPSAFEVAGELQQEHQQVMGAAVHAESARSVMDMTGVQFPQLMTDFQDIMEARDYQLSQTKNEYTRKVQEYKNTFIFKAETARREHGLLNSTLRDRLINQMNHKKARLQNEKEAFDISDTNALILNPSQFSLANPGSPGGQAGKRSTRTRKDAALDMNSNNVYSDAKKRKRNGGDDDGSPAPTRRALDTSNTTPFWQSEKARTEARKAGSVYSIGSLFTEKELSMQYNTAAQAAHLHMTRHRITGSASSPESSDSGNGESNDNWDNESQPSAPVMERQISHATRSTRGVANQNFLDDRVLGIEGVPNYDLPSNLDLIHSFGNEVPKMPQAQPTQYTKPPNKGDTIVPKGLSDADIFADCQIMASLKQYDQRRKPGSHLDNPKGIRKTFEAVSTPYQAGKYIGFGRAPREDPEDFEASLGLAAGSSARSLPVRGQTRTFPAVSAAPMSRQSSAGGVAMSRQEATGSSRGKTRKN
ncbi:hypothetical protein TOPH_00998 [Tolypocladium ophioglossoides CBS 100239]|uniref:Deacetylase complex subunit n=1 Tax=Tolypocladium ophioglossoides (strain CBS 100239) TaxID=1163406 RepID=A0A0L0NJX9_TOLOC|nr:hypothetical protein TOPH_00998 [Tolypocladium ophioglossoides CBS 100239]